MGVHIGVRRISIAWMVVLIWIPTARSQPLLPADDYVIEAPANLDQDVWFGDLDAARFELDRALRYQEERFQLPISPQDITCPVRFDYTDLRLLPSVLNPPTMNRTNFAYGPVSH